MTFRSFAIVVRTKFDILVYTYIVNVYMLIIRKAEIYTSEDRESERDVDLWLRIYGLPAIQNNLPNELNFYNIVLFLASVMCDKGNGRLMLC